MKLMLKIISFGVISFILGAFLGDLRGFQRGVETTFTKFAEEECWVNGYRKGELKDVNNDIHCIYQVN